MVKYLLSKCIYIYIYIILNYLVIYNIQKLFSFDVDFFFNNDDWDTFLLRRIYIVYYTSIND